MVRPLNAASLLLLLAVGACTSDQVVGRYRNAQCEENNLTTWCEEREPKASAAVVSIETPAGTPSSPAASAGPSTPAAPASAAAPTAAAPINISLAPAADHALAACVAALNVANPRKSVNDFCTTLSGKPAPPAAVSGPLDKTIYHRTLIVTVRKEPPFNPADRLEATDVTIETPDAVFDTWDTLATPYTTVNAGTVQLTQAHGLTESLSVAPPAPPIFPVTASGTLGGSQTDTRVENLTATAPVETLTATIACNRHCIRIRRQGAYGIDLTGNTVIKVDMSLCDAAIRTPNQCAEPEVRPIVSVPSYKEKIPKKIALSMQDYVVPSRNFVKALPPDDVCPRTIIPPAHPLVEIAKCGIAAKVTLTYTVRHVDRGAKTYEERDDDVREITTTADSTWSTLIAGRDTITPLYALYRGDDSILEISPPGGNAVTACFASYDDARDFMTYLRVKSGKTALSQIGGATLTFVDGKPKLADIRSLEVRSGC